MFGVSVPQASKDLSLYQERAPGNVEYDKSVKRYVVAQGFEPRFLKPDPDAYLPRCARWVKGCRCQLSPGLPIRRILTSRSLRSGTLVQMCYGPCSKRFETTGRLKFFTSP